MDISPRQLQIPTLEDQTPEESPPEKTRSEFGRLFSVVMAMAKYIQLSNTGFEHWSIPAIIEEFFSLTEYEE